MSRVPALLLIAALAGIAPAVAAPPRPNIVFFLADDLGWADVSWHGSRDALPALDALAAEGLRLEAHYVNPMCSPTRAALLSGRYASRFGVTAAQNDLALPLGTPTLASILAAAGYDTALVGKWHLGSKPEWGPGRFGFDFSYGSLAGGVGPFNHLYRRPEYARTWHRNGTLVEEQGHVTDLIAREAVAWIERRTKRPLFLCVPFTAIHVPIDEPREWLDRNAGLADPAARLRAACSTHMDDCIRQGLAAIDRRGLRGDTIVIFASDNGAHRPAANAGGYPGTYPDLRVGNSNAPLRGHKTEVYEGGIRTPAVVAWPGRIPAGARAVPLHIVDWLPTLAGLAGVVPPADLRLDGIDVFETLVADRPGAERPIYSVAPGFKARAVRLGDWKLIVADKGRPAAELYNLADDISERHDLAAAEPERVAELRRLLAELAAGDDEGRAREGRPERPGG